MAALRESQRRALHVLASRMLRMGQEDRAARIYAARVRMERFFRFSVDVRFVE